MLKTQAVDVVIKVKLIYILCMPTNVTPEYRKAEEAFRAAKTTDEKIERLEDAISLLPKHKGTDHLYADLKRRLATLRRQLEVSDKKARRGSFVEFLREGAAQIILVGPPNSGKSSILKLLTNAHPEIGTYPFTTNRMQPGMIPYEDIQIQLVDTPPVTADFMPRHLLSLVRRADGVLLVADMSTDSLLDDIDAVLMLSQRGTSNFYGKRNRAIGTLFYAGSSLIRWMLLSPGSGWNFCARCLEKSSTHSPYPALTKTPCQNSRRFCFAGLKLCVSTPKCLEKKQTKCVPIRFLPGRQ